MILAPDVTNFTYILETTVSLKFMNNKTTLAIAFLLAGTLFTGTMAMAPVYAGGDSHKKGGDGNKQKVEDESAGAIADCDKNEVERADFNCFANAATEDSEINERDGDGNLFPRDGECQGALVEVEIDGITICVPPGQVPE
jgi:hypothetical protein